MTLLLCANGTSRQQITATIIDSGVSTDFIDNSQYRTYIHNMSVASRGALGGLTSMRGSNRPRHEFLGCKHSVDCFDNFLYPW